MQPNYVIEAFAEKPDKSWMFTVYYKDEPDLLLAFDNVQFVEDEKGFRIDYDISGSFLRGSEEKPESYIQERSAKFFNDFLHSAVNNDFLESVNGKN